VCIDLDKRIIEYYLNGKALGEAFNEIAKGENIAYFPAVSLSKNEKICFNFGGNDLEYTYPGYQAMDFPESIYKGIHTTAKELIEVLDEYMLKLLNKIDISINYKYMICQPIFYFLANIAIYDTYVYNDLFMKFLYDLASRKEEFETFFSYLLINSDNKPKFVNALLERIIIFFNSLFINKIDLTNLIENYAFNGNIERWEALLFILMKILSINDIVNYWILSGKIGEQLNMIFNSRNLKFKEIIEVYEKNKSLIELNTSNFRENFKKLTESVRKEINSMNKEKEKIEKDERIKSNFIKLIKFFLNDTRHFTHRNRTISFKSLLLDTYFSYIKKYYIQEVDFLYSLHPEERYLPNNSFIKNFYMPLLEILSENYSKNTNEYDIEPW
jgi:hypothetical protein